MLEAKQSTRGCAGSGEPWQIAAPLFRPARGGAQNPIPIRGERLRRNPDRDVAIQPGMARAIELAHSARADTAKDLVRADAGAAAK